MKTNTKIIIGLVVIAVVVIVVGAFAFANMALAPLEQRQDKTTIAATQNVEIEATTFNGKVEIQTSNGNNIEITYNLKAPTGHLTEITTTTTNETKNGNTLTLFAEAKLINPNDSLTANHGADIIIKLPETSQYNLTLRTLNGNIIKPQLNDINVIASTNNGNIDIKDSNYKSINASTLNGDVDVSLQEGTLFQVEASTANGHVSRGNIQMNTEIETSTHLKGSTQNGAGTLNLTLTTANGDIKIEYLSK